MIELEIDENLITLTNFFMTDQKIQLVFNRHNNKNRKIKTEIPQCFPVLPILFLIYFSEIFEKLFETSPSIVFLSFVDGLRFVVRRNLVKEIVKALEKIAQTVVKLGLLNTVLYNMRKTEAILFLKSYQQQLNKQLWETEIKVGNKKISFNKEATQQLEIWLDSQLKFIFHINKKVKRVQTAKIQIKGLTRTYGVVFELVCCI